MFQESFFPPDVLHVKKRLCSLRISIIINALKLEKIQKALIFKEKFLWADPMIQISYMKKWAYRVAHYLLGISISIQ